MTIHLTSEKYKNKFNPYDLAKYNLIERETPKIKYISINQIILI
jgi:hypothetical protein